MREGNSRCGAECDRARPWYVLGPGHRWPYLLLPIYKFAELIPKTRKGALRLGLVEVNDSCATANLLNPDVLNPWSDGVKVNV